MRKKFDLPTEIKKLLTNNRYYLKYNRKRKNLNYEKNYHHKVKDPDGKVRVLTNEKYFKLKQLKYIISYLKKKTAWYHRTTA